MMIDAAADLDHTLVALRRWLFILGVSSLVACGSAPDRDLPPERPPAPDRAPAPSTTTEAPPERPSAAEAVREWIRAAPGHASASVERVEPSPAPSHEPMLHVVARDGSLALDAWVPAALRANADAYWLVAELVSIAQRAAIDDLVRGYGWTLWTIAGRSMLCRDTGGACYSLPEQRRVQGFFCQSGHRRCTMFAEAEDGRVAEWRIDAASGAMHRRRVRSWPAIPEPLEGRWDAGARVEHGPRERLAPVERPAIADDPALGGADPDSDPDGLSESPCTPQVRSFRRGALVVRAVGCEVDPFGIDARPVAFVVTRGGQTESTPLFIPSLGPPAPLWPFDVSVLAGERAIGFVAIADDGGSPSGDSSEDLWVFVPPSGTRGARLHSLSVGGGSTTGLGTEDEREGYVVEVERSRSTFEVTGPGAGRFTAYEEWVGTHSRGTRRWRGEHHAAPRDRPVTFDPDRGFEVSDQDCESPPCVPEEIGAPSDG